MPSKSTLLYIMPRTACGYAPVYHAVCPLTRYHIVRAGGHKALCPPAEHLHFRWETPRLQELSNNKQRWQHGNMFTQRHQRGARRVYRQSARRGFRRRRRLILMQRNLAGLVHQRVTTIWMMGL